MFSRTMGAISARTLKKGGVGDFWIPDLHYSGASRNLRAVKEMLGHADVKSTMRYVYTIVDDLCRSDDNRRSSVPCGA